LLLSQVSKATESSETPVLRTDDGFSETGLKVDSAIRLHHLVTIPIRLIQKQLGTLPVSFQEIINQKLTNLFEL
jgi:mRNA-degrading endonuclease toxin of MazEF toxin-antitoxin module